MSRCSACTSVVQPQAASARYGSVVRVLYQVLVLNVVGGAAVLGSYAWGIASHDNPGAALWGAVPEALRPWMGGVERLTRA